MTNFGSVAAAPDHRLHRLADDVLVHVADGGDPRVLLVAAKPPTWPMPRPWTPTTATRMTSLGPTFLASSSAGRRRPQRGQAGGQRPNPGGTATVDGLHGRGSMDGRIGEAGVAHGGRVGARHAGVAGHAASPECNQNAPAIGGVNGRWAGVPGPAGLDALSSEERLAILERETDRLRYEMDRTDKGLRTRLGVP